MLSLANKEYINWHKIRHGRTTQHMTNEMGCISRCYRIFSSKSEKNLSAYLDITIQHVQSAAIIHHVMVHKQQKHLVISKGMSQNISISKLAFFLIFLYTFIFLEMLSKLSVLGTSISITMNKGLPYYIVVP